MARSLVTLYLLAKVVIGFPWVANLPGVDRSLLHKGTVQQKRAASCPFNTDHRGAAEYSSEFPYTGARDGLPGTQVGGIKVPADGDTAHEFEAPGDNDIRGPCPGLNAAANHRVLKNHPIG